MKSDLLRALGCAAVATIFAFTTGCDRDECCNEPVAPGTTTTSMTTTALSPTGGKTSTTSSVTTQASAPKPPEKKLDHPVGYQDTPMQPNGKWHVHDGLRPQPTVVNPGLPSTPDRVGQAPSDAVVLFDGTNLDKWKAGNGKPSGWKLDNGAMVVPAKGTENGGDIITKDEFGDCQLHVEFAAPNPPKGDSQGRGNSGIFLMGRYECQVLDAYNNPTYADGTTGSVYSQYPPLVNAVRPPGEWQTYDILWTAPRFKEGKLESPAFVTILINGVVVQNHTQLWGNTPHRAVGKYEPHSPKGPIKLQDHGDPVRYRNIWIREIKQHD